MEREYWTGAHTKHRLKYHRIPKYRKRILSGKLAVRSDELLKQACDINRWKIEELNIQTDHIHILIQLRSDKSLAKTVPILKGGSSRAIRKEFPKLDEFLWGNSLWVDGYFAETVGIASEDMIKKYIQEQRQ